MEQVIKVIGDKDRQFKLNSTKRLFEHKNIQEFPFDLYFEDHFGVCASIEESAAIYTDGAVEHLMNLGGELVKYELTKSDPYLGMLMHSSPDEDFSLIINYNKCFYCFQYDSENKMFAIKAMFSPAYTTEPLAIFKDFTKKPAKKSKISVLITECGELSARSIDIETPKEINLSLNYGKYFEEVHERITNKLSSYKNGGLYMFHGDPGTGKSTYIRYLTSVVDREFIFIPSNAVEMLTSPSLLSTLLRHKNSVLVIEDAEKAIESRENNENASLVSVLLNMSDGLLGSLLQISLIISYNCEKNLIDPALLRKGRLIQDHGFKNLNKTDAQLLINHLGYDYKVKESMSLAEIYNLYEETGYAAPQEKRMGFNIQ